MFHQPFLTYKKVSRKLSANQRVGVLSLLLSLCFPYSFKATSSSAGVDMIGSTSTGGLVAIILCRLQITVDECITASNSLSDKVPEKKSHHRVSLRGKPQGRFDAYKFERPVKKILVHRVFKPDKLLRDVSGAYCKVYLPLLPLSTWYCG